VSTQVQNWRLWACPRNANEAGLHTPFLLLLTYKGSSDLSSEHSLSTHECSREQEKGSLLTMPHSRCTICTHPERQAIEAAREAGDSLRKLAKRFGVSYQTVHLHAHEDDRATTRINTGQIAHIDEEIKKLTRAQNRAKKKRDNDQVLAISRELRNWFLIKQNAETASMATAEFKEKAEDISPREALGLAKSVIETQLQELEVHVWLLGLADRVRATGTLPDSQL
jgi:hypothetical protein